MFRIAFSLIVALSSVAAFAPSGRLNAKSSSIQMKYENALGAQPPLGFFDPLGYLKDADDATFNQYRNCELKHGRIAMLAVLGHIVTTKGDRLPGDIAFGVPFSSIKAGLAAFNDIPLAGLMQLFFFIGLLEAGFSTVQGDIEAACVKEMKRLGWSEKVQQQKAAIELNNGRAAQMGILGLVTHELINNDPYVLNSMLGVPVAFNQ